MTCRGRKWTERDVAMVLDQGRRVAKRMLDAFDPDPARTAIDKAAAWRKAPVAARRAAIDKIRAFLRAEGAPDGLAEAHLEGAVMLIGSGDPLIEATDRARLH